MKNLREVSEFLNNYINYEKRLERVIYNPETFNLEGFRKFLDLLNNPQKNYPSIHIAGTKGKGSTGALLEAALGNAGFFTGLYTSPHIHSWLERMRVCGEAVSEDLFVDVMNRLRNLMEESWIFPEKRYRTVFELVTAAAFIIFREKKVDTAVMETGLGGRLDATNVITPALSIITAIGMEHTHLLGDTIEEITAEKAGIIKPGVPVLVSGQQSSYHQSVMTVLQRNAAEKESELFEAGDLISIEHRNPRIGAGGQRIHLRVKDGREYHLDLPLSGPRQAENCRTAIAALVILEKSGWNLDMECAIKGIRKVKWPGRFQLVSEEPPIVIDAAHCPLSIRSLCETMDETYPEREKIVLLGVLKGKNAKKMAEELAQDRSIRKLIVFPAPSKRGKPVEELSEEIRNYFPGLIQAGSLEEAIRISMEKMKENDAIIVAGSIYNLDGAERIIKSIKVK